MAARALASVGGVLFLCSDLSKYVTGQVLHINGGFFTGSA